MRNLILLVGLILGCCLIFWLFGLTGAVAIPG
jgi:hypothetical protein